MSSVTSFTKPWGPKSRVPEAPEANIFTCSTCGHSFDCGWQSPSSFACSKCAPKGMPGFIIPLYMQAQNEDGNAKQKAYMESPEVQAKLKSGEYEIRKDSNR